MRHQKTKAQQIIMERVQQYETETQKKKKRKNRKNKQILENKRGRKEDKEKAVINIIKDIRAGFYTKEQPEDKKVLRN